MNDKVKKNDKINRITVGAVEGLDTALNAENHAVAKNKQDSDRADSNRSDNNRNNDHATSPSIAATSDQKAIASVYHKAVDLLAMREHSEAELVAKLQSRFESGDYIDTVIQRLKKEGFLSDLRFSESYVRLRRAKGFGPVKIRYELRSKGVDQTLIDECLSERSSHWLDVANAAYKKKYRDQAVTDYNTWSKHARFLHSRGFTSEHIQLTLPEISTD